MRFHQEKTDVFFTSAGEVLAVMSEGTGIAASMEKKLKGELQTEHLKIEDLSDGCGQKFELLIVSPKFEGMALVDRSRTVHEILKEEIKAIHAITLKNKTPAQWAAMQQQQSA